MTRAEALEFAKDLDRRYPNWLNVLPACPCKYADAQADPKTWNISGFRDAITVPMYHPGAAHEVRSQKTYESAPGTHHGQQCCYDSTGALITEGAGAGTPDLWSPVTHSGNHMKYDVKTFDLLGWRIYTQYWRPNQGTAGCGCKGNAGGGSRMTSGRHRIVGDFKEIDLFIISIPQRTVKESENVLVVETGRRNDGLIGGRGHYSEIEVLPENQAAVQLFGNSEPRYVPSYLLQAVQ